MAVLVAVLVLPLPAAVGSSLLMLLLEFCSPTKRGSPCYVFCPSNGKRAGIPFRGRRPCFHFFPSCPDNYLGIPGSSCLRDNYLSVDHRTDQWVWWSGYELWPEGCELSISCLLRASAPCGNSLQRRLLGTRYYSGRGTPQLRISHSPVADGSQFHHTHSHSHYNSAILRLTILTR